MPTIAVVTPSRHDCAARSLRDHLATRWPGSGGALTRVVRHAGDGVLPAQTLDACVVLHPSDIGEAALHALARELRAARVPVLALGSARDGRLDAYDIHFMPANADGALVAGMLAGLAAGTPGVRQLEESLRYAQSVHESVARLVEQFQDDQLLAASIQRQFVSQEMPVVDGVSCAALFRPIDFLSGDIYRVVRLDETHIGFFLGDAMGHGLPAALMALYIAGRITQKEVQGRTHRIVPPSESMTRLNRDLSSTGCSNVRFATAVCGTLNVQTGHGRLAGAGHPPPIILGSTNGSGTRLLTAGGPLLCVMDDSEYEQAAFTLGAGETLILYSDGLEDTLNPRHPGEDQESTTRTRHIEFLEQVVREVGGPDPEKMCARFTHIMDNEAGSMHQVDDVTLVGIRMAGGA